MLLPVILAGGVGSRLWPASRALHPKQFQPLHGSESLFAQTLRRLEGLEIASPTVVCAESHRFLVGEALRQRGYDRSAQVMLEPVGRNTAPAIALVALNALEGGEDPLLLVLAADHLIHSDEAFRVAVRAAQPMAEEGDLVTFGVPPDRPETGYGYIRLGNALQGGVHRVDRFVEKPDAAEASDLCRDGAHLWNSGMFLFRASRYIDELTQFAPAILEACRQALSASQADGPFLRVAEAAFAECPSISVDYAVMEHTNHAVVVPLEAGWSDLGSWQAVWEAGSPDCDGNVVRGDVVQEDCEGTLLHANHRLVAALGLEAMMVVETRDALLVAPRTRSQDVKRLVARMEGEGRLEVREHGQVERPWGAYRVVDAGQRYQVKRLTVRPGARLSLQLHYHRAEHWVVVSGSARVTRGEESLLLTENESTFIPVGVVHTLENPGSIPLEIIEVQSGAYLGEDDIVRLDDDYGRA